MEPKQIYSPKEGAKMRIACFVSGSGTNARKIIARSKEPDSGYEVSLIFTDVRDDRVKREQEMQGEGHHR